MWIAWHAAIVSGTVIGSGVPAQLRLHLVVPLFLLAEVVGQLGARPARAAALTAAIVAVVGAGLPLRSGLLVAMVAGVVAAAGLEGRAR